MQFIEIAGLEGQRNYEYSGLHTSSYRERFSFRQTKQIPVSVIK